MCAKQFFSRIWIVILSITLGSASSDAQHYAAEHGWKFINFDTAELPWDLYRDTYIGIPPTRDPVASGFDVLFYDLVYKSELSKKGNCYGMSLQSLLMIKKGGNLGYCDPVPHYSGDLVGILAGGKFAGPTDPNLTRAINQMHGHQVSLPSLKLYLDILAKGKTRDAIYAYDQMDYYKLRNDPTLVNITKSLLPTDGAHTMVAYDYVTFGPDDKRIYIYDPNRSWYRPADQTYYSNGNNYIKIKSSNRSYEFTMAGGTVFSGNPSSGGNITITPISIAGPRARVPSSMGLNLLNFLNEFFVSDAELVQVTNSLGKRLFRPGTIEVDIDPETGLLNMTPWYFSDLKSAAEGGKSALYFMLGNPGGALDVQVRSKGNGYYLVIAGQRSAITVHAEGGSGIETLTVKDPGTNAPQVTVRNQIGVKKYTVALNQVIEPAKLGREFKVANLAVAPNTPLEVKINPDLAALEITNSNRLIDYDLQIKSYIQNRTQELQQEKLQVSPGEVQNLRPLNWQDLKQEELQLTSRYAEIAKQ